MDDVDVEESPPDQPFVDESAYFADGRMTSDTSQGRKTKFRTSVCKTSFMIFV